MRETVTDYEVEKKEVEKEKIYCDDCHQETDKPTFEVREVCDDCRTVEDSSRISQSLDVANDIVGKVKDTEMYDHFNSEPYLGKIGLVELHSLSLPLTGLILIILSVQSRAAREMIAYGLGMLLWGVIVGYMVFGI